MKKYTSDGIRKRIPIQRHFLTVVLLITLISILAVSTTAFFSIRWIRSATSETLANQLAVHLRNVIQEKANSVDAGLRHYEEYIRYVKDYIENMYADEDALTKEGHMFYPPKDTTDFALTRAMASSDLTEEDLRDEILFFSHLEKIWEPFARENENIIPTMYLGTEDGLMVSYDRYSYLSVPPEGEEVVYNYFVSEWYKRGMSEDGMVYTGIYMDSQGRGLTMTIASGFQNSRGETAGVICLDFDLMALYEQIFAIETDQNIFTFVLDQKGTLISPESDILDLTEYTGLTLDELDSLKEDPDGVMEAGDSVYACVPLSRMGWTLCARVPVSVLGESIEDADRSIWKALAVSGVVVLLIILAAVLAVRKAVRSITRPLELLRHDIKVISDGDLSYRAVVRGNDEIGDISSGMNEMVDRLNFTLNELMSSQQHADAMSRLATLDTLTGIRNKTAFDRQSGLLKEELEAGERAFGFAMIDLNNLKVINDNYGHEKGDTAIRKLCGIICRVFDHSPVYRVGGDEFVVLLKGEDYQNIEILVETFLEEIKTSSGEKDAAPWEKVSAAIGYALYDETTDEGTDSVLARADAKMYACKKRMKEKGF